MTARRDHDLLIRAFLDEGQTELPDRAYNAVRAEIDQTRQRVVIGPWREPRMTNFARFVIAAAAVLVVAMVGINLIPGQGQVGGPGGQPSPSSTPSPTAAVSPTVEPTEPPSPTATPEADPDGDLAAGTYAFRPLPAPNDSLTLTVTVPEGWYSFGGVLIPSGEPGTEPPGGMAILFNDVTTINGDPCDWSGTADDVSIGPAVDDLVDALLAQTPYEVSQPVDVTIGGYSGKRVDIVVPTEPFEGQTPDAPDCDEGVFQLWNTAAWGEDGIYAQGPADRWRTNILDVDGTRFVIVTRYFPGTSPADRAEMNAIIDSIVIDP
jgi:hypothetical protein